MSDQELSIENIVVALKGSLNFELIKVLVEFDVSSPEPGIQYFFSGRLSAEAREISASVKNVVEVLIRAAQDNLKVPPISISGRQITPTIDIKHIGLELNNANIRVAGLSSVSGGPHHRIHKVIEVNNFNEDVGRTLNSVAPWARRIAEEYVEERLRAIPNLPSDIRIIPAKPDVFLSYKKGEGDEFADRLFHRLGQSTLVHPIIDTYDIEAGLWLRQLQELILVSAGMVIIYTESYDKGNISALEGDQGLLQSRAEEGFKLIPIWLTAEPTGFLKQYQCVDFRLYAQNHDSEVFGDKVKQLLDMILGIPRNPYRP